MSSLRTGRQVATSTRSPATAMRLSTADPSATASPIRAGRSKVDTGVPGDGALPRSRAASSLHTDTRPSGSTANTPSPIPCSTASRCCTNSDSSDGSRPNVRRFNNRFSNAEPATPNVKAPANPSRHHPSAVNNAPQMAEASKPTLTSPTIAPVWSRSGTLPRAEYPSVPVSMLDTSLPATTSVKSVLTSSPTSSGLGCA